MKDLFDKIISKRRHLVVEEGDITRVLTVINSHYKIAPDIAVGNCGWDDSKKWFVHFDATEVKWTLIRNELKVIRVFCNTDIPENTIGKVYSTD